METKPSKTEEEQEKYLTNILTKMLQTRSPSGDEGPMLDLIIQELTGHDDVVIIDDRFTFGILVLVPSSSESKNTVLFDAHIDIDYDDGAYEKVEIFEDEDKRRMIRATGLDNKTSCALLLSMIKFVRFENTSYLALFSIEEELGFVGAQQFSNEFNCEEKLGLEIDQIVVLDVFFAKLKDEEMRKLGFKGNENDSSKFVDEFSVENWKTVIGKGPVPMTQLPTFKNNRNNILGFERGLFYKEVEKTSFGIGCAFMHEKTSLACLDDLLELYLWIQKHYSSKNLPSIDKISVKEEKKKTKEEEEELEEEGESDSDNDDDAVEPEITKKTRNDTEEIEYLEEILFKLIRVFGKSQQEDQILDFIEKEIKSFDCPALEIKGKDKSYGLYVHKKSLRKEKEVLFFDAHCDTVHDPCDDNGDPQNYEDFCRKHVDVLFDTVFGHRRKMIYGPGLDNRTSCAILLTMLKYHRFDNISYFCLFSTQEEIGLLGCFTFSEEVSLKKLYDVELDCIVILDVTAGKTRGLNNKDTMISKSEFPIVGAGFCPIQQEIGKYKGGNPFLRNNSYGFMEEYKTVPMLVFSVPCAFMHDEEECCCFDDMVFLYLFLCSKEFAVYQRKNKVLLDK